MAIYLRDQVEHGAQAVQIFDSWIGALGCRRRAAVGAATGARLLEATADLGVPRIYFANGGSHLLHDMRDLPCEVIGLDWRADLAMAARALPDHVLQGNLDPGVLMGPDDAIRARTVAMLETPPAVAISPTSATESRRTYPSEQSRRLWKPFNVFATSKIMLIFNSQFLIFNFGQRLRCKLRIQNSKFKICRSTELRVTDEERPRSRRPDPRSFAAI